MLVMYVFYFVICSLLFYAIFPKTTGQRKRRAATNGAVVAFMATAVMRFAVASRPWVSYGLLLLACANVALSFALWRIIAVGEGGSLRVSSAICATILILCVCWLPLAYSLDCFVRELGSDRFTMGFGAWVLAIAFIVLLAAVWSTFCSQRRYSRGVIAIRWVAIVLAVIMTVSSVVSAAVAVPQSKSVKAAGIPSVFATDGEAFEGLKEFFGRIFGNPKEAALTETDDESVAAEVADDESVAVEVAEESVAAEVAEKAKAGAAAVGERKWKYYKEVVDEHPYLTFHHFYLFEDDNPDNNSWFASNEYDPNLSATEYLAKWKKDAERDPLMMAGFIACVDAARHTDLIGSHYKGDDGEWADIINQCIVDCLSDQKNFVHLSEVFLNLLANEARVPYIVESADMIDQMYVDGYTYDGIPKIVVVRTHQKGHMLVVPLRTKGDETNDVLVGIHIECWNPVGQVKGDKVTPLSETLNVTPEKEIPKMPEGYDPPEPTKTPTSKPEPTVTPTPTPVPGGGSDPTPKPKAPKQDPVNRGEASKGGGDNNSGSGSSGGSSSGEEQKSDPRQETKPVSETPQKKPETPPVVEQHKQEQKPVVDHENKKDYTPDPVTERGAADGATAPTETDGGDGEFVPED